MTYVPPPIIVPGTTEEPKCPFCHKELEGWSEPSDITFKGVVSLVAMILFLMFQGIGVVSGLSDASWQPCEAPFSKRYHYLMPTYPAACAAARWLENKEVYDDPAKDGVR